MQPQRSSPYTDSDVIKKANDLTFTIETAVSVFAKSSFPYKTIIERFTEVIWYCYKSGFLGKGPCLLSISVEKMNLDQTRNSNGFYIDVNFLEDDLLPQESKIKEFINTLNQLTKLPVRCTVRQHYFPGGGWF